MSNDEAIKQDLERNYNAVIASGGGNPLNIKTDINYRALPLREIFNGAMRGEALSSARLESIAETLTGKDVVLIRDTGKYTATDFSAQIKPAYALFLKQSYGTSFTRADREDYDRRMKELENLTAVPAAYIKYEFLKKSYDTLGMKFMELPEADRAARNLGIDLMKKANNFSEVMASNGYSIIEESKKIRVSMEEFFQKHPEINRGEFMTQFSDGRLTQASASLSRIINETRTSFGYVVDANGFMASMVLPDLAKDDRMASLKFSPGFSDLPNKPPPWSNELFEFLINLHESEHVMLAKKPLNLKWEKESMEAQLAKEIDADGAVIDALKQVGEPGMVDYWLALRNTLAFGDIEHNTSLYFRLREQGQELDIEKFVKLQQELLAKIGTYIDITKPGIKFGEARRAALDMLRDDREKPFLTPYERAALEQYDKDLETIGYPASETYPRPQTALVDPATPLPKSTLPI